MRAAAMEGKSVTEFVLLPAVLRAREIVSGAEPITTSAEGYKKVLDALANPPEPTRSLVEAMRDHQRSGIRWR